MAQKNFGAARPCSGWHGASGSDCDLLGLFSTGGYSPMGRGTTCIVVPGVTVPGMTVAGIIAPGESVSMVEPSQQPLVPCR